MGNEERRTAFARAVDRAALPLLSELARFAERAAPGPLVGVAQRFFPFWGDRLDEIRATRIIDFLMFDFRNEGYGRRAIDEFSVERAAALPEDARAMLAQWSEASCRLYVVDRWSGGFVTCSDALGGRPAIEVLPLRGADPLAEGRPIGLRALACAGGYFCTGRPIEFDARSVEDIRDAIRARHLEYVRTKRIVGIDEFLRAEPTALDEEAAVGGRASGIIVPGRR